MLTFNRTKSSSLPVSVNAMHGIEPLLLSGLTICVTHVVILRAFPSGGGNDALRHSPAGGGGRMMP